MKIIIVGCGKVGLKIVEMLHLEEEHDVTAIDLRSKLVSDVVNRYDIMGIVGNGANIDTLFEAGVREADIVIAVTGSDELNLLTCFMAKKAGNCQTIARVGKPEYNKAARMFKDDMGLTMIINPDQAAANKIAGILRFPSAIQIDTFAKGKVEILKFKIPENSELINSHVYDIRGKLGCDVLVCGVERGEEAFIPGGDFVFKQGDFVSIVASLQNSAAFLKKVGIKTNRVKDTMIVGGGKISYYLASVLSEIGIKVKIIEQNAEKCEALCELLPKVTIVHGDGTDNTLLLEEGIEYADSFVALTNIDEENILLSLFARSKTKGKLITKINRIAYDGVIENLNLDTTIYPKNITAEHIVRFVRAKKNSIGSNIETMHFILGGKAEALEFRIRENSPLANSKIEDLNIKKGILIACINRNGKAVIPKGNDVIVPGDTVIIVTMGGAVKDINDIFI